jgi:AcrR family transcriptional regulator
MSSAPGWPSPPDPRRRRVEQAFVGVVCDRGLSERRRIEAAIVDLCFEHGYRETTLEMLLDRAEVGRDAFESHFADLEDCFCQVYEGMRDDLMTRVAASFEHEPTWRDSLRAAAYTMVDWTAEDEKRTKFTVIEVRRAGERAMLLMGQAFEELFDLIDRGRGERSLPGEISRTTAEGIGGTIFTQMYAAYEQGSIEAVRGKIPEMMYMAVRPYLGEEVAAEELEQAPRDRVRSR